MYYATATLVILVSAATVGPASPAGGAEAPASAPSAAASPAAPARWQARSPSAGAGLRHVLHQLNLSPEQKTQVKGILEAARERLRSQGASVQANRVALARTAPTDPAYPALLATAKADAASRLQQFSDLYTQIYAVLTPAQQAQIPQLIDAQQAKWAARRAQWQSGTARPD